MLASTRSNVPSIPPTGVVLATIRSPTTVSVSVLVGRLAGGFGDVDRHDLDCAPAGSDDREHAAPTTDVEDTVTRFCQAPRRIGRQACRGVVAQAEAGTRLDRDLDDRFVDL